MSVTCEYNINGKCLYGSACDFRRSDSQCSPEKYEALIEKLRSIVLDGDNIYVETILLPDNERGLDNIAVDL